MADFFLGESLVGDGNEVAHIDLIIGSKSGPAGHAFCNENNPLGTFDETLKKQAFARAFSFLHEQLG